MSGHRNVTVFAPPIRIDLAAPPRPDGYRPIAESLWRFGRFGVAPSPAGARYVLSAARRLDAAHALIERVRDELGAVRDASASVQGSIDWRRQLFALTGDSEIGIIALHRAIDMAKTCRENLAVSVELPGFVASKVRDLRELRDAYEHIEERALLRARRGENPVPVTVQLSTFDLTKTLVTEGVLRYERFSLGIDAEATRLMNETRDYLVAVWGELNQKSADGQAKA